MNLELIFDNKKIIKIADKKMEEIFDWHFLDDEDVGGNREDIHKVINEVVNQLKSEIQEIHDKELTFKEVLDKIDNALELVGWKGGNKFDAWKDGNKYFLSFETFENKEPNEKRKLILLKTFKGKKIEFNEDIGIVIRL